VVVEDDVSLHNRLSVADARATILHGFDLACSDGWMYLGLCGAWCDKSSAQVHGAVAFSRCCGLGSHVLAFTKRRAATFVADMHASVKHRLANDPDFNATYAQSVDRMLIAFAQSDGSFAWLPASSLSTPWDAVGPEIVDCPGVFFQDRPRFHSMIGVGSTARWGELFAAFA